MLLAQLADEELEAENAHFSQGFTTMKGWWWWGTKQSDCRLKSFYENCPVSTQSTAVASLGSIISSSIPLAQ